VEKEKSQHGKRGKKKNLTPHQKKPTSERAAGLVHMEKGKGGKKKRNVIMLFTKRCVKLKEAEERGKGENAPHNRLEERGKNTAFNSANTCQTKKKLFMGKKKREV